MKKILLSAWLLVLLTGCNTITKQSFNSAANQHLQQIALVKPPNVDQVEVSTLQHVGASFGLVGGLIAAADMTTKTNKYNAIAGLFDWDGYVHQQLYTALVNAGYEVRSVNLRTPKQQTLQYLKKYPELPTDAAMDYYFSVGQVAAGSTTPYVPTVVLHTRLVDTRKKAVLYEQHFNAGLPIDKKMAYIPNNHEYRNAADLFKHAEDSKEALKFGIQQVAQQLTNELSKQK